ncbi:hypothetical protein [Bittarella massiliensis (ex Durand et al. 2017)]|uniref:hypothetical protein n=1 Tax=Bittarella massiliensis (ex Durand et al. 2017) TaxID=1720313 RepID=UPI001AA1527D|nr:hypothetical protein [Bittarella massiliensis (ex Durand et al. 2017)]MBO1678942.1 hypothetical protein [Bittarella massiliensis (ex Durand et al. 2017)]
MPVNFSFNIRSVVKGDQATIQLGNDLCWPSSVAPDQSINVSGEFKSLQYTHYSPSFVETKLLDEDGNRFGEGNTIPDGAVVTVQAKVKNANTAAGSEVVYAHLKQVDKEDAQYGKYPTAGLEALQGAAQKVTVDGVEVSGVNIVGVDANGDGVDDGIPFTCSPAETVITYRAMVQNTEGKAVTIGQMMVDDFFQSKRYSGAELISAVPLVPYDPEKPAAEQGTAGKDYHYTRTPANENGWNAGPVEIAFYPDQFNQFLVKEGESVAATLDEGNRKTSYSQETGGTETAYQAKNTQTGELSTTVEDAVKIDVTAPTLAASGKTLTLSDNLSGVWKVERYDAKTGRWTSAQTFSLTGGNGAASQTFAATQNGKYRVLDAAGNLSDPLAVTVNDPPSANPSDPGASPSDPEKTTDETGLVHLSIRDRIQEVIDRETPLYGGRFTAEDAKDLFDGRYGFSSNLPGSSELTYSYAISQGGKDVTGEGVDTTRPGAFTVTCVVTDAEGNTTTVVLTDTLVDRDAPPTVAWGENPNPPVGPSFDPLKPLPQPAVKDDPETGRKHAHVYDAVTEVVGSPAAYGGQLTPEIAQQILQGRYQFGSAQGDGVLTRSPVTVTVDGREAALDTAKPGSCVISQTVTDSQGNRTTVHLTYTLLGKDSPPAVEYNPEDETVEPGSHPDGPEVVEDWQSGAKYATVTDRLVQAITDPPLSGGWLDGAEIRALIDGRYRFTSAQPDGILKETRFAVTQNGKAVEGIDTALPGEYVIAYTLEDSSGNRTSLFLQYVLAEKTAGGSIEGESTAPGDGQPNTGDAGAGLLGREMGRKAGSCGIHWGLLSLAALAAGYTLFRKGQLDREEEQDRETL